MRSVSLTRQLAMSGQPRGAVGVQRHHGQRHRGVGNVVAVERDRLQRPAAAPHLEPAGAARRPARPSPARRRRSAMSPWIESQPDAFDAQRRRRCAAIAPSATKYDADDASPSTWMRARRAVGAACGDREALPAVALHRDAEARQQVQRDLDVGLRDQLAVDLDHDRRLRRRPAAAPAAARSGTGSRRRRARGSVAAVCSGAGRSPRRSGG